MIRWVRDRPLHLDRKFFAITKRKIFNIGLGGGMTREGMKGGDYQKTVLQTARGGKEGMSSDGDRHSYGAIGALRKWPISNPRSKVVRGTMSHILVMLGVVDVRD